MAGIKRKQTSETSKANGALQLKKLKHSPSVKKTKLTAPVNHHKKRKEVSSSDSDDVSESETSDHGNEFDSLSDDAFSGNVEDDDGDQIMTQAPYESAAKADKSNPHDNSAQLTSSREAHAKQKALAKERKASKPNADIIIRSKKLWEQLRRKSHVPKEERKKLVDELFDIVTGRVKDFVFKHDAVRVIQCALKYANMEQRKIIAKELKGEYINLAESRYAKFLIGKLLVEGDTEIRKMIISEFYGHVKRLINHPEASWILDDTYRGMANADQKAILLREWYGPEFAIFKSERKSGITSDLTKILEDSPEKRKPIMNYCRTLINQLIQKKLTGFTMLHDAMLQYFLNTKLNSEESTEFIELFKTDEEGDLLKNLAFTKSGSHLVCLILAHSTAKDRKAILKTYKDIIGMLAQDPHGHKLLLTAYDVIDDTKLTTNTIFPELLMLKSDVQAQQENILNLCNHAIGRIPLLYPLSGFAKWLLPDEDITLLKTVYDIRSQTSKKDPEIRRIELITSLSSHLISALTARVSDFATTSFGCQFITETFLSCSPLVSDSQRSEALKAVAEMSSGNPEEENHISQSTHGARMLKSLVAGGRFDSQTKKVVFTEPRLGFADILYERIKDHIVQWATGTSSFVIVGLVETDDFSAKDEVLKLLRKNRKLLKVAAETETETQRAMREQDSKGDESKGDGKKQKKSKVKGKSNGRPAGNAGSRLLLETLG